MRRSALHFALIASVLGAFSAWGVVLGMGPQLRARDASNRLVERAQELASKGDRTASRRLVGEALEADASNARARRELAMHLIAEGLREPALAEMKRLAVEQTKDSGAARELAALLAASGDIDGAISWLREAIARDPENALAYVDLSRCLMEIGEVPAGLRAAEKAVALAPRLQPARLAVGRGRWLSRDLAGALSAFEEALELRPGDVAALIAAAAASGELGHGDSALRYARQAVTVDPQNPRTWMVLAGVLATAGRSAESHEALAHARSLEAAQAAAP